ncbi:MAG: acyltransferase [Ekhidna sp.]
MVSGRRYDIDWLRVIAIGLLLVYHVAIAFQPWGVFIGFIQTNQPSEAIFLPMSMLNVWRIPLLFFVSGMGVCFAIQRRSWKQLIIERSKRILLPYVFGMAAIVPIHVFLWQKYYHQELAYSFSPAHLWFLGNIFIYVLLLSPIFFYLKKNPNGKVRIFLQKLLRNPLGLLVLIVPFILEAEIVKPESFEMYALSMHGFALGMIAFLVGFCLVYSGDTFWETVTKWRWPLFTAAFVLYLVRLLAFELRTSDYLMAIESNLWIFTVFGFGYKHLNHPGKALTYLSQAAYPVYIIHMAFIYLACFVLFPLNMASSFGIFLIVNIFTFAGSMLTYEFVIKRIAFIRPLFGLKTAKSISKNRKENADLSKIIHS